MEETKQNCPPTKITKTWFIQRGNNENDILACDEYECWNLLNNKSNWRRNDFKIIGVSDGSTYVKTIKEGQTDIIKAQNELNVLSQDLTRYLNTRDKFKFEELLLDTDEKVIRVNSFIKDLENKISEKNKIVNNSNKYIVDKAFQAELSVAKGHIEMPKNFDIFTPHGNRDKILNALGK